MLVSCTPNNQSEADTSEPSGYVIGGGNLSHRTSKDSDELGPLELVTSALERYQYCISIELV